MPRTLASLLVTVAVLAGSTHTYARGVHFGLAGPSSFIHPGSGFLDRHIIFKSLAATAVVFVPCDDPYAVYPIDPCYVALPWVLH
jgi:hypothetical protein